MNSFNKMINAKVIKRIDSGMLISIDDIHVNPELDIRVKNKRLEDANEELFQHIMNGGKLPALEVEPREEGGVWVIEGMRRRLCYLRARDAGKPIDMIKIDPFVGNDLDKLSRVKSSNKQLHISDYEEFVLVKQMMAFNIEPQEMADRLTIPRYKVDNYLILVTAGYAIQQLVKDDAVDLLLAVERIKKNKDKALELLQADANKAQAEGKKRATKSTAIPQFSAKKSRTAIGLLSNESTYDFIANSDIPADVKLNILEILDEYREFSQKNSSDSGEGDSENQLEIQE